MQDHAKPTVRDFDPDRIMGLMVRILTEHPVRLLERL